MSTPDNLSRKDLGQVKPMHASSTNIASMNSTTDPNTLDEKNYPDYAKDPYVGLFRGIMRNNADMNRTEPDKFTAVEC